MARVALVLALTLTVARARADVIWEPTGMPGEGDPRALCHRDGQLGFNDDQGLCVIGWDGLGEPPDAGPILPAGHPQSWDIRHPERHVQVAAPVVAYASLAIVFLVCVAFVLRAVRKKPKD